MLRLLVRVIRACLVVALLLVEGHLELSQVVFLNIVGRPVFLHSSINKSIVGAHGVLGFWGSVLGNLLEGALGTSSCGRAPKQTGKFNNGDRQSIENIKVKDNVYYDMS